MSTDPRPTLYTAAAAIGETHALRELVLAADQRDELLRCVHDMRRRQRSVHELYALADRMGEPARA